MNIIRDAAQLQLQLRQYDGLQETRLTLLKLRPFVRTGWLGLAVAYRLNGNAQEARKVLKQYISSLKVREAASHPLTHRLDDDSRSSFFTGCAKLRSGVL